MRVPVPWLREYVDLSSDITARDVADRLIGLGLEVETVIRFAEVSGPVVFGRVTDIVELTEFKKPIRVCQVEVGSAQGGVRQIVCGAVNFKVGDGVVVALPGAVLPGGFEIAARKTYGHTSDGMMCSASELEIGTGGSGILVVDIADSLIGSPASEKFEFNSDVLDIAVTPDRGYAFSIRGVAREAAIGFDARFTDRVLEATRLPAPTAGDPVECSFTDGSGCDVFTARTIQAVDCAAPTPNFIVQRLLAAGMRPVSVVVDITNYVMLETGQPLHAFDGAKVAGSLHARRARQGEWIETLDHVERALSAEDLVIADDSGPIALAGTMGGAATEIDEASRVIVLEAAHFDPVTIARMSRRHRLSSEASRRFERGIDHTIAPYASEMAAALIIEHAGGEYVGMTAMQAPHSADMITILDALPAKVAGAPIDSETTVSSLVAVGCEVRQESGTLTVTPPPWRPDLTDPADLVEEVLRLFGYANIPATLPRVTSGTGLSATQRFVRRLRRRAAADGLTEVVNYPFVGVGDLSRSLLADGPDSENAVVLSNPLSDEQPMLATTLLPGLFATSARNISRGASAVNIFELGAVFVGPVGADSLDAVSAPPTPEQLTRLNAALPTERKLLAGLISGEWERAGWWGRGRNADWSDSLRVARALVSALHVQATVQNVVRAPFHPGRAGELRVGETVVGYAGELHPQVIANWGLLPRSAAFELDVDALVVLAGEVRLSSPQLRTFPVAKFDLALVVDNDVPAAEVECLLADGCGAHLESVRLFDVYYGNQIADGKKSLAFAIRLRADDRTLTEDDVARARAAAVANVQSVHEAALRA